jgi:hypothetical protein
MTNEQIVTFARLYESRLLDVGLVPVREDTATKHRSTADELEHVLWMLREIVTGNVASRKVSCGATGYILLTR